MSDFTEPNVVNLINRAIAQYSGTPMPERIMKAYLAMKGVRNKVPGYNKALEDTNDEVMAAAEHHLLCRAWVGNGKVNKLQMKMLVDGYNGKKRIMGVKRHNPANPATPYSKIQNDFQIWGIARGEQDRIDAKIDEPDFNFSLVLKLMRNF